MTPVFDRHSQRLTSVLAALMTFAALWSSGASSAHAFPWIWGLSEFQPNIPHGGRANTIAVHPIDNDIMFVASESGGIFKTTDRGATWKHIDAFKPYYTGAIAFVPSDPKIVIATAGEAFTTANEAGGIWRSTDSGATWTHVPNPAPPTGVTTRFGAGEISIAPDTGTIYVATTHGLSVSSTNGASWSTLSPFSSTGVSSVIAHTGNLIVAGNASGVRRSTDGGISWPTPATQPGAIVDMHAVGRAAVTPDTLYVVNAATELYFSENGAADWSRIASAPAGGAACGGIAFIKPIFSGGNSPQMTLYFGNRCGLTKLVAPKIAGTTRFDYSGAWSNAGMDHGDTRDLAFATSSVPAPLLLATDGGLHRTADGGNNWTFTGGGAGGYNALQITEVKGQLIQDTGRYDLYFGTQDKDLRASGDMGTTWPALVCCEGFFLEMKKRVATASDSQVTFVACSGCGNYRSGALFGGVAGWPNPPGGVVGNPVILDTSLHIQGVGTQAGFTKGFAVTQAMGSSWTQYAEVPEDRYDIAKTSRTHGHLGVPGSLKSRPVQYQSVRVGFDPVRMLDITHLVRLTKRPSSATATVYYPAMNSFGGFGINPTMFAWYQVFGVDPKDARHIIAPDIIHGKMMETWNGGNNWSEIPVLTALVTDGGRYLFHSPLFASASIFPHASAVSFYSQDPNMVAVGTHAAGIFISRDRGASWDKVPGSEIATVITALEWRPGSDLFVSTYGRGLWRVNGSLHIPQLELLCEIVNCLIRYIDPLYDPDPTRFVRGIFVMEGRIAGVRLERARVIELFITPGSSIGYVGDASRAPKIRISETARRVGVLGMKRDPIELELEEQDLVGLALDERDHLFGTLYTEGMIPVSDRAPVPPEDAKEDLDDHVRSRSPTEKKPYVSLGLDGSRRIGPGERFAVSAVRLQRAARIEVLMDGKVVETAAIESDGTLSISIAAPMEFGLHTLTLRDAKTRKVIDGASFLVTHGDQKEERSAADRAQRRE